MLELQEGVTLSVIPTQKFKTVRIFIRFTTTHERRLASQRTLLTSVLETSSAKYPRQTDLSAKLAQMYGASFGMNVTKKGNLHQLNVSMSLVNGKYLSDERLLSDGVDFLEEVLFSPLTKDGLFDEATFELEKANLIEYIESVQEDKQALAGLKLQELYFDSSSDQGVPSFGLAQDLRETSNADLMKAYQKMMTEDQVDIIVVGDVTQEEMAQLFSKWHFSQTKRVQPDIFYRQDFRPVVSEQVLRENVTQSKLNLAYHTDIYYTDEEVYALTVFNGLFGGFPHSKLFMNVREKESLAYYASSSIDSFRGLVTVQTGIDGQNREKVMHLISEQLTALAQGDISEQALLQTKAMIQNHLLLSLDNAQALTEMEYMHAWLPNTRKTPEEYIEKIMQVTKEEVQQIAKKLRLQAVFFLEGSEKHA